MQQDVIQRNSHTNETCDKYEIHRNQYHYTRTILLNMGVLGLGHMSFWQSILLMNSVKT
jgi:hypothetical protein